MPLYHQMAAPAWGTEGDYHLLEGRSPAINGGLTQGAAHADDLEGRPRDVQPGLGVYER